MKIPPFFKPSKKKVIIFVALVLVAILGFTLISSKKKPALQAFKVIRQDIKSTVSASGTLTGKNTASLKFKASGKLAYINVKAGDVATSGSVIAGLDTQDLSITLQQARNTYRDKQAIAEKVEDDVKDHSKDETFTLKATRTTAQAARDSAYDAVKAAQRAFQDAVIVSPINGIITQAIALAGQTVTATDLIALVVDTSEIYFDSDIDEADFNNISTGLPAEIVLDAYPNTILKGSVDQILPATKTTSQGATVVTVRIKLDNPNITFINGLTGQATIITKEVKNAIVIPQEALKEDETVVLLKGTKQITQKVVPGIRSDTDVEIKEGLQEGENIIK